MARLMANPASAAVLATMILTLGGEVIAAAPAQTALPGGEWVDLPERNGVRPQGRFGDHVATVGDVDGDGLSDFLVGAETWYSRAFMVSGTGNILWSRSALPHSISALAALGDVDGDGRPDVVVATGYGSTAVLSGADGTLIQDLGTGALDVAGLGDVDGDGSPDVALGNIGLVEIRQAATNQPIQTLIGSQPGSGFGRLIDGAGDLDGDGVPDLVALSPNASPAVVEAVSLAGGAVLYSIPLAPSNGYGHAIDARGDVDGDGIHDLAIGIPDDERVQLHSGIDGTLLAEVSYTTVSFLPSFGCAVSIRSDVDGDGLCDLAVGAQSHTTASTSSTLEGLVVVYRASDWELILEYPGQTGDELGAAVEIGDDFDGDGRADVLMGGPQIVWNTPGVVRTVGFRPYLTLSSPSLSISSGATVDLDLEFPVSEAGRHFLLLASAAGAGPTLRYGFGVPLASDPLLRRMWQGWTPPMLTGASGQLDAAGRATATLQATAALGGLAGTRLHFAAVTADLAPTPGLRLSSASAVLRLLP